MSNRQRLASLAAATTTVAAMMIVIQGGSAGAATSPSYLRLAGSVAPFASMGRPTRPVAGSTPLTIQVWMRSRNLGAAQKYAMAVSTPGSGTFHHYLSPDGYTARFGPSKAAARSVSSWLRKQGFTGIKVDAQRNYVRATGQVTSIDAAFKTQIDQYRSSAAVNACTVQRSLDPSARPGSQLQAVHQASMITSWAMPASMV